MPDVFLSYSRRDSDFARRLAQSVHGDLDKDVWIDTEGIAAGEVFPDALKHAIEESDTFLFVITPESVASSYCEAEVAHAVGLNKRILPVLRIPVADDQIPPDIRFRNWIHFNDDATYDSSLQRLSTALDHDLAAAKAHTRWLVKAREWDDARRDRSLLLRGSELKAAESWLAGGDKADPAPTALQRELVRASRQAASRRQRILAGASVVVAVVSIALLVFALISRSQANHQRNVAEAQRTASHIQALTAESQAQLANDPELAIQLAARAVKQGPNATDELALRQALDTSSFVRALPNANLSSGGECTTIGLPSRISPDGKEVAAVDCHGLRIMNATSGRVIHRVTLPSPPFSVGYRPDGAVLAVGTDAGVTLIDARTGAVLRNLPGPHISATVFSPDGSVLVAQTDTGLTVYRGPGYTPQNWKNPNLNLSLGVGFLGFSHDGRSLYVAGDGNDIYTYDMATGSSTHHRFRSDSFAADNSFGDSVAVSPDGSELAVAYTLAASSKAQVAVFDTHTFAKLFDVATFATRVTALAISADDTRVAVGLGNGSGGVWTVGGAALSSFSGQSGAISAVSFSSDGSTVLASSNDGTMRVWRSLGADTSRTVIPTLFQNIAFRSPQVKIAETSTDKTDHGPLDVGTYRSTDGVRLAKVAIGAPANSVLGVALSPDGSRAFTNGTRSGDPATLWDVATGKAIRTEPVSDVFYPVFNAAGDHLVADTGVSGSSGGTARIIDLDIGRAVSLQDATPCGPYNYGAFAWSANGKYVAGSSYCGDVTVWNTAGHLVRRITDGGDGTSAAQFDINPDGSKIVVALLGGAKIFSVSSGRLLHTLQGAVGGTVGAAFSPDGSIVMTTANDDSLRLWDAATGNALRILSYGTGIGSGFSADGKQIYVYEFHPGQPTVMHILSACPGCGNPAALLAEAASHETTQLTSAERRVLSAY